MKVSYIVVNSDEAIERKLENYELLRDTKAKYGDYCWVLYRCEDSVPVEYIAQDGGEPEDQLLVRDWGWVPVALQKAYELGLKHGKESK